MEVDSGEHIEKTELAKLLEELRLRPKAEVDIQAVHPHLASCASCGGQFEGLALLDRELMSVKPQSAGQSEAGCSGPELWRAVAGGLAPPEEFLTHIEHASRCGHCGPLLQRAVAELAALNGEVTEAERKQIANLESHRAKWQRNLAKRIAASAPLKRNEAPTSWWRRRFIVPRLVIASAFVLALMGAGVWFAFQRNQPAAVNDLLARAYTEKRTVELRMAGADYAPVRISRGASASFASRPAALLRAEAVIAAGLESHRADPAWLQAQAKADLLEGKYDAAVEALHRALELTPGAPDLLTDLATAHFQRALEDERKDDFDSAFEYLSQALTLRPEDPVALFNRAIVAEHQFLYRQALEDWDHYLRVDAASPWAVEAQNRADAVREKLKRHGNNNKPLLTPAEVVARIADGNLGSEVDQRIEEYLHEAVRFWLPAAFPEAGAGQRKASGKPSAVQALFFLAELTRQRHGDQWLADFLRHSSNPGFSRGVGALALSVKANDSAEYGVSRQETDLAEQLFRSSGNTAGVVRAEFERTFAAQVMRQSDACRRQAKAALTKAKGLSYRWLEIQLDLENAICSGLMNDAGVYENVTHREMEQAQKNGYGALYLRALGFATEIQFANGDYAAGSKLTNRGLELYWSNQFPVVRGYNLYDGVAHKAELAGQVNLAFAVWREATALIEPLEDQLLRAWAHRALADAAAAAHQPQVAQQEYVEAARLFALAPQNDATRSYAVENEISIAQLEGRFGRFDGAVRRLVAVQSQVRALSNDYLVQLFYSTLGELELGRQRAPESELALRPALALAEKSLATLSSEDERTQWKKSASPAYLALCEAELVQGRPRDAVQMYERYLGAPRQGSNSPRLAEISSPTRFESRLALLAKETVVVYATLPDGLAIWVYDDRGLKAHWVPKPTDELRELAERFQHLASDPNSELIALRRDAHRLYLALIAPVERDLAPGRTLVIESEGWLARVPFEALVDSSGHYLVERGPLVHSVGENGWSSGRNDPVISAQSTALVVGSTASSPAEGLIPLPDVAAEAETVASAFHPARVLTGNDATLGAVRNEFKNAAVFHYAGHSLATAESSGLLLQDETGRPNRARLLDAAVVRQLPLQSLQLAVLSACSTGPNSSGTNGFDSITDAFLRAGVPHVVASRWAVDSSLSRGFVEDFYRNLLSGKPVAEAIQLTSNRMLVNPRTSHPYYWSAFAAYGER